MNFNNWLDTYIEEAEIDIYRTFDITTDTQWHNIPVGNVIEFVKENLGTSEQAQVKDTIVKIDFAAGNVYDFFEHLATMMAKWYDNEL